MDAQDVAHFLYKGEGLNKTAIGKLYEAQRTNDFFFLILGRNPTGMINFDVLHSQFIGDYLGEKNDFNEQVLRAFVELHDFTNLILVQALRYVVSPQISQ